MRFGFALLPILVYLPIACFAVDATPAQPSPSSSLPTIDCNYQFSKDATTIDPTVIETWSKHAALQLFTFNNAELPAQLSALKNCFTEQGWQGFNTAFQKSGNLDAIKARQLVVSATIKGEVTIQVTKDNQWKVSLPMDVVYQNKDNKIDQSLTVSLLIIKKPTGGLGLLQIVAVPLIKSDQAAKRKVIEPDHSDHPQQD